jgi:enoyl-CoA hydratase
MTGAPEPLLIVKSENGTTVISINRPERRNALSLDTLDSLRSTFETLSRDPELKCVILTGAGERSFAAGGDLKELASYRSNEEAARVAGVGRAALDAIRQCPAPVYAAINGHALGGGAELAMACDFRLGKQGATIGFLQGKLNITTAWGGGTDLIGRVGADRGLRLLLSSQVLDMQEALAYGLIDQIVPKEADLIGATREHAAVFISKPAHVIQAFTRVAHAAKSALRGASGPVEERAFLATWVHEAHWSAASKALTKSE